MNVPLAEVAEPLRAALSRLVEKDEDLHPFVVVERARTEGMGSCFVQFAGSRMRPLVIDCPALSVVASPCTIEEAPDRTIDGLRRLGMTLTDEVAILEHQDKGKWWKGIRLLKPTTA